MDVLPPDQAIMPMVMAKVLIGLPGLVGLRRIVPGPGPVVRRIRREDRGTLVEIRGNHGPQSNRVACINTGREVHGGAALSACGFYRPVDRGRVDGLAVASGTEHPNIEDSVA